MSIMHVANLGFEGLEWRPNLVASRSAYAVHLIENVGGGVVDIIHHIAADTYTGWFSIHIGQVDRLTFFGDPNTLIQGSFIDCRDGSPTLHRRVDISFNADPNRHLFIDRGIGHILYHKTNITVRVEVLWYMSLCNPDYDFANDSINFRGDELPDRLPIVKVNDLPLPDDALQYVLTKQQQAVLSGGATPPATRVALQGTMRTISGKPARD